jgi:hypothetical protein
MPILEVSMAVRKITQVVVSLTVSLSLISCTFGPKPIVSTRPNIERLLQDAGFVRNPADSPEKMARIRSEVQRKVFPVREDGQTYYLYADADFCRCLYVGDERAFNRFEELLYRRDVQRSTCIDDRLRSVQDEPWREFGELGGLCGDRP